MPALRGMQLLSVVLACCGLGALSPLTHGLCDRVGICSLRFLAHQRHPLLGFI